ncbi:ribosome-associated protein IOJAP [Brachyspira hyodysenteriae]|uniref:ribosome silencing factor n=1 Tax=Brachyspira hyodysenteriae TaxID=159 RepID=UPI00063D9D47|nr:ribosome silencing factor [Brachyspira hyodysenteriae]KLI39635.1 ribosome-associated protein IOJAP [Brachyspira hyodysenteriae]
MKLHNNNEENKELSNNNANEVLETKLKKRKKKIIDREKAKELTFKAAKALYDKKLEDIVILDLEEVTTLSDFFILATASSSPQMKAGSDAVYKDLKDEGVLPYAENDNDPESVWYLSDYGFLVVHIFTEEGREYYNLDKLWHEAKKIDMP